MGEVHKVAAIQLCSSKDRARNLAVLTPLIEQAARAGAQFIATPEMTNIIDTTPQHLLAAISFQDNASEIAVYQDLARAHAVLLLIGSVALRACVSTPRKAVNRSFLFGPQGDILATYDKIHMFDVDLSTGERWRESQVYLPGTKIISVKTHIGHIGLSICYDLRFPILYRRLAQEGAQLLCVPSAFTKTTGKAHWEVLLRARAIETGSYVIAPAQGGTHEDGRHTFGHSMIIDPWGEICAKAGREAPKIIYADIDLSRVTAVRQQIPSVYRECAYEISSDVT